MALFDKALTANDFLLLLLLFYAICCCCCCLALYVNRLVLFLVKMRLRLNVFPISPSTSPSDHLWVFVYLYFCPRGVCKVTYTSLLTQCARLGQADRARVVLDELYRKRRSGGSAVGAVSRDGEGKEASAVGGDANPDSRDGGALSIDPKLENDLLKLFGQADQVDAAFKVGI